MLKTKEKKYCIITNHKFYKKNKKAVDTSRIMHYNNYCCVVDNNFIEMRKCWNWQTGKTKDLVSV